MTKLYLVRHAQPQYAWKDDRTRPLTEEGWQDSRSVSRRLIDVPLDYIVSSPYLRSIQTIEGCAEGHNLVIHTEERFRERECGPGGNSKQLMRCRWENFDFCEEGGESLREVQARNMEALQEILATHPEENILLGTHGTAMSTILQYYMPEYNGDSFFRMIDFMPYIVCLEFEGERFVRMEELFICEKQYHE